MRVYFVLLLVVAAIGVAVYIGGGTVGNVLEEKVEPGDLCCTLRIAGEEKSCTATLHGCSDCKRLCDAAGE